MRIHPIRFPASLLAALTGFAALLSSGGSAWASDHMTASGDWSNASIWDSGLPTTLTTPVVINPGFTGTVTTAFSIAELRLGFESDGVTSETVDVNTGGSLSMVTLNGGMATGSNGILNINGGTVTVSGNTSIGSGQSATNTTNGGGTGTLNLTGGSFTAASNFSIGSQSNASGGFPTFATGHVTISGGTFTANNGIQVGSNGAFSTGNTLAISGTSVLNWAKVGSAFSIYNGNTVTVTGSAATLAFTGTGTTTTTTFSAATGSTLSFVLDSAGLSTINLNNTALSIASGALLTINGSAYTGGTATFNLFSNVGTITGSFTPTITGFNGYTTVLVPFSNALVLEVTQVPEPGAMALLAAGLGLLAFALRKRILAAA